MKQGIGKTHKGFLGYMDRMRFDPGFGGIFLNPFYFARTGLRKNIKALAPRLKGAVLDAGCGSKPYKSLISCDRYDGLEIDTPKTRAMGIAEYFYDGTHFPFSNSIYDGALCNQVLEHVFKPDAFLSEINRVLKPGGLLLLTVPFVWDEHEQPYDYARYSSFGLAHLLSKHGFKILEHRKSVPTAAVIFQLVNGFIYKKTHTKSLYVNMIVTVILMAPFNILGLIFGAILPTNKDLYLDNVVLAQKI